MNSQQQFGRSVTDEISIIDILRFLKGAWKSITIFGLIGIALSSAYLAFTPKQYEAVAKVTMAQIGTTSNNNINNNNINPLGINVEEPALLIARLSSPTSFTPQVIEACDYQSQADAPLLLSKSIKLTIPKGLANIVELKTFGSTQQVAQECALAIFELIRVTQAKIVDPYIADAKIKLDDDIERLTKAKDFVAKADKSGQAMSASYLSTRDEVRFLLDEITALKNVIISNQNRATHLVAPIYTSNVPISPKKLMTLASGLFGGLFLGLLMALARQMLVKLKSAAGGVL